MRKRQFAALFLCNLAVFTVGVGLLPLLPVYATRLGAGPVLTGYYLAFAYVTLTASAMLAGWLSDVLQRRKALLIVSGVLGVPVTWLMGQVTGIYGLAILTATVWFLGGVQLTVLGILAGLFAAESERGRVFGILEMTAGLGTLLAGLTMGSIADRWGYPTLFRVTALWWILFPLSALFLEDKVVDRDRQTRGSVSGGTSALGSHFWLLAVATLTTSIAVFVADMGRSLTMHSLGFLAATISSVGIVAGIASLVRAPLLGWVSDRVDRRQLLMLTCLVGTAGLLLLSVSTSVWHFWVATALLGFLPIAGPVGKALVSDWVPQETLGVGMSLFLVAARVGGVIGFASTGHAIESFGMGWTFLIGALLAVVGVGLLASIRGVGREELTTA
jgi:MFS family permease